MPRPTKGTIFACRFSLPIFVLAIAVQFIPANANSASQLPEPPNLIGVWWVPLAAAFIGAAAALITPFIKDYLIQKLNERRSKSERQQDIFRNYAAPLAASSEKLLWRFSEIFLDNGYHFLKKATLPLVYNEYKRKSTLYRIASVLGWIRAMQLELSALPRGASGFLTPVASAISKVQSALADGRHVEIYRLEQMCSVWRLSLDSLDGGQRKSLATEFEVKLYELSGSTLKHDSNQIQALPLEEKLAICKGLSDFLCRRLQRTPITESIVAETINQAIRGLSYREALIYRDWQDAIGDVMLEADPDSVRRFKIVGYERFEQILLGQSLWMEVFRDSIVDIDFDLVDPNDFRAKQLKDLASGIANIIISLSQSEEKDLVGAPVLDVARKLAIAG